MNNDIVLKLSALFFYARSRNETVSSCSQECIYVLWWQAHLSLPPLSEKIINTQRGFRRSATCLVLVRQDSAAVSLLFWSFG